MEEKNGPRTLSEEELKKVTGGFKANNYNECKQRCAGRGEELEYYSVETGKCECKVSSQPETRLKKLAD